MKTSWLLVSIIVCLSKATTQSNFPKSTCDSSNQFDCGTECIPKSWECDNIKDCPNGADEIGCDPSVCTEGQILCEHGGCVSDAFKCDGHRDCYDGSDENYCGPISYKFSENSSLKNDGGYDVTTQSTSPKTKCDVSEDFDCGDNTEDFLLLKEYDEIKKRSLDDLTNVTTVYKNPEGRFIRAFDYSRRDNTFFMSIANERGVETEKLVVVHNGSSRVLCENSAMKKYEHLAVDWIGNNLFFQEEEFDLVEGKISSKNFISVCTMDGRFYRRLIEIEDDRDVQGFAIHPMRGLLFWHDSPLFADSRKRNPHRIMMANMDGSKVQPLVRSKSQMGKMFAIDRVNHDIYFENKEEDRILRVNIDSKKTDVVASDLNFSSSETMAYHNGFLYLHNSYGSLRVLEVSGARVQKVLELPSRQVDSPRLIVNDSLHQLEPSAGNPCLECPWICVIVPDFTAKCLCPDGYTSSGTTCIPPSTEIGKSDNLTHIGSE